MSSYAKGTEVAVEKTRAEIERELTRFGATAFTSGFDEKTAHIMFRARDRWVRLTLPLPQRQERRFWQTNHPRPRPATAEAALKAWDAERRRLWRSLLLLVKAKLAAVHDGIVEFEEEFLPHIVMPHGDTVYERIRSGRLELTYQPAGTRPALPAPEQP